jgi:hypothetical protein
LAGDPKLASTVLDILLDVLSQNQVPLLLWIRTWIRIRMDTHKFELLDPVPDPGGQK